MIGVVQDDGFWLVRRVGSDLTIARYRLAGDAWRFAEMLNRAHARNGTEV